MKTATFVAVRATLLDVVYLGEDLELGVGWRRWRLVIGYETPHLTWIVTVEGLGHDSWRDQPV